MLIADWWPWIIVGAALLGLVAHLLYRRTDLKPGRRLVLVALRLTTLGLLGLAVAGLACVEQREGPTAPVGLLIDDSASMDLRDADGVTRAAEAARLAAQTRAAHPELEFVETTTGHLTDGGAVDAVERLFLTRPELAAAVVIGDDADREPQNALYPVHALAVTTTSDFDLELGRPRGPRLALSGRKVLIELDVGGRGRLPATVVVGGTARPLVGGDSVELRPVELEPPPTGAPQTVEFTFTPHSPGWWLVEFELAETAGEATPRNNLRRLLVHTERGELSALVLARTPSPEAAFLSRALARIPGVEVEYLHRRPDGAFYSADGERRRPGTVAPDALFLVDLVPTGSLLNDIAERNAAGRGTAFIWGRPGLSVPAGDPLWALLPFEPTGAGLRLVAGQARPARAGGPLFRRAVETGAPALLSFTEGLDSTGAVSLELENPSGRRIPGALAAPGGAPRLLLLGGGWWRWELSRRAAGPDDLYTELVGGLFAALATDPDRVGPRIALHDRYPGVGDRVDFEVIAAGEPLCRLLGADEEREIGLSPAGEGRWRGSFTAPEPEGLYRLTAVVGDDESVVEPFIVEPPLEEFGELAPDAAALERLAGATGGVLLQRADETFALSPTAGATLTEERPLGSAPLFLAAVVVLLGLEWYLRRRFNLR